MLGVVTVESEFLVSDQSAGPKITDLADGGFVITWFDYHGTLGDTSDSSVKAQIFNADGHPVGSEFLVNTETANHQERPAVTGLADGGFVVTWQDGPSIPESDVLDLEGTGSGTLGDNSVSSIKAQVFSALGTKIGGEFLVNSQTAGHQGTPQIAALADGGFVVTWQDGDVLTAGSATLGDTSGGSVKAQVFSADGAKVGSEFLVNTQTDSRQRLASVTGLKNGDFVVTWQDLSQTLGDDSSWSIKAQLFSASGGKIGDEFLVNTSILLEQIQPTVTALDGGGFAVSWRSWQPNSAGTRYIKSQIFDSHGAKVGSEFNLGTGALPTITSTPDGGFVAAWSAGSEIDLAVVSIDGTITDYHTILNTSLPYPFITGLKSGGFALTWQDQTSLQIKAQVFGLGQFPVINSSGGGATGALSIAENSTAVTTVTATDADANSTLSYSISGGLDASLFKIDAITGALSFKSNPNFESPVDSGRNNIYDVVVQVSDGFLTDTQALVVTVTDINDVPVITSNGGTYLAFQSINENTSVVTKVTATDDDKGTVLTYAIHGGADAALFKIDAATGDLSFKAAANFEAPGDADHNNVYEVKVRASDGSLTDYQIISITVTNINEAPVINSNGGGYLGYVSIKENTTAVTKVTATDIDQNTQLTYSIAGGADGALFKIDPTTGDLAFKSAVNFDTPGDADGNNVYEVKVRASDGSLADWQEISVTVTNVNEAPVITSNGGGTSAAISVAENGTAVTTVSTTDVDAGTALLYSIAGGSDAGLFRINAQTGALTFAAAPDFEVPKDVGLNNVYDVTVKVSDGQLTDTQALAITVTNVVNEVLIGTSSADTLTGAGGDDTLWGGAGNDRLTGNGGNDGLNGGTGADIMDGGAGHDTYIVDDAGDQVIETAGNGSDTVKASISYTLGAAIENLTLTGSAYLSGTGNDLVNTLIGNDGDNLLTGLGGSDTLNGGAGSDTLLGGLGRDVLTGGTGRDFFVFNTAAATANVDTITDFNGSENDKIQLGKSVYSGFTHTGALTADEFYAAAGATSAHDATDRVIYNTATGILYYDADGQGGIAAVQFALMGAVNHPTLIYSDIMIIV
ncbi:cadherin domain-containing protein [Novosphingobium sp.]|uniref:cadherin domain-containing protein n=1 Tax=Novosphingobium sp. TaxID=1874826 RepID=UPI003BAD7279